MQKKNILKTFGFNISVYIRYQPRSIILKDDVV